MTTPTTESESTKEAARTTMRALVQSAYGNPETVMAVRQVETPSPAEGQVLVRVHASSVNALDWHFISGTPYFLRLIAGLREPKRKIPGADVAGTVVEVGSGATSFKPGDRVFGEISGGGMAEFVAVREGLLAPVPTNIAFTDTAALGVAALTALQGLRDWGGLEAGQSVLINGASGGVGTFAIQMARALGASHITAVCSTGNVEAARALGADVVIDYTKDDFVASDRKYDLMFDNAGNRSLGECRSVLKPNGTLAMVTGKKGKWIAPVPRMLAAAIRSIFWSQNVVNKTAKSTPEDLLIIKKMVEASQIVPAIERTLPLDKAIEALQDQGEFHARAKTLILVSEEN